MNETHPASPHDCEADDDARLAAIARLQDLFSDGRVSPERFAGVLEQVLAAPRQADLEAAMVALPPLVRSTHASRRLTKPLVLHAAGSLCLGSGLQLAADTTIRTGVGVARLDLTAASWDDNQIDLHLETWGLIEVLIPEGVAVQLVGGSGNVEFESLSPPIPGGPVLRVSPSGPTGAIRIRHPMKRVSGRFIRRRRRRTTGIQAVVVGPPLANRRT